MGTHWRDPIELPRWLRISCYVTEVGGFAYLSIIFFFFRDLIPTPLWARVSIGIGGLTFAGALVPQVADGWGSQAKPFVRCILEKLGTEIWAKSPDQLVGPREQHRITLFRVVPLNPFYSTLKSIRRYIPLKRIPLPERIKCFLHHRHTHKLVPCLRVPRGPAPRRSFYIHERFLEYCEGVAGLVYAYGQAATEVLPDLHAPNGASPEDYDRYARMTCDTAERVRAYHYYSRRIGGVTAQVDGERWGALILDSTDPHALTTEHLDSVPVRRTLALLTAVLEEIE